MRSFGVSLEPREANIYDDSGNRGGEFQGPSRVGKLMRCGKHITRDESSVQRPSLESKLMHNTCNE